MTRRDSLLRLAGLTGAPVLLAGCSMESIRRAEAAMGDSMRRPGTGLQFSKLPKMIKVLATYPATPQQARVAEQRARTAVSTIAQRERRKAVRKAGDRGAKPAMVVGNQTLSADATDAQVAAAVLRATAGTTNIAINTVRDGRQQGDNSLMIYNVLERRLVGNNVYDIQSAPPREQVVQIGDLGPATYLGQGTF